MVRVPQGRIIAPDCLHIHPQGRIINWGPYKTHNGAVVLSAHILLAFV